MFLASIIFFCCSFYVFLLVSKILSDKKNSVLLKIILSILNTILMLIAYEMRYPYYVSYFFVLAILTIEFKLHYRCGIIQAFLCSGIIIFNISEAQMLFVPIYSYFIGTTPYEIFNNPKLFFHSLSLMLIMFFIVFKILFRFISTDDMKKLLTKTSYSLMVSAIIIFILVYTSIDSVVLQSKEYTIKYLPTFIFTPILTLVLFYTLLFYSIKSVKIVGFKRKSDELEVLKLKNSIHKKYIESKVLKDDLTSCYNRKYIMSNLEEKYRDNIFNFAILFVDIDGLKMVNDTLGHEFGDQYIINISNAIREAIRDDDLVARIGGDEFLVVLNDIKEDDIDYILNRINEKIDLFDKATKEYKVSASIGYIFVDEELLKTGVDNIIRIADDKMRIEKKSSKGE